MTGESGASGPSILRAVALNRDGSLLASGSDDGNMLTLWDVRNRKQLASLPVPDAVTSVAFNPPGDEVAAGSKHGDITFWDVRKHSNLSFNKGHANAIWSLVFTPQDTMLLAASEDWTLSVWGTQRGPLGSERLNATGTEAMDFAAAAPIAAWQALEQGVVTVVDTSRQQVIAKIPNPHSPGAGTRVMALSPDGRLLAIANDGKAKNEVKLWDVEHQLALGTLQGYDDLPEDLEFSPDGTILATGGAGKQVTLWNTATRQRLRTLGAYKDWIFRIAFSPSGTTLAAGDATAHISLWDVGSGTRLRDIPTPSLAPRVGLKALAFGPGERSLAIGDSSMAITIWDVTTGTARVKLRGHTGSVLALAFSPDGKTLASGSLDKTVSLWDVDQSALIGTFLGHLGGEGFPNTPTGPTAGVTNLSFGGDGRWVVSGSDIGTVFRWSTDIHVWKLEACEIVGTLATSREPEIIPSGVHADVCR